MTHLNPSVVRRISRAVALTPAILVFLAAPAFADAPAQWADPEPVSTLHVLLILVAIPAALFAIISLLVYLPSLISGERYTPGLAWRNEAEWFGGPSGGIEAADSAAPPAVEGSAKDDRGGASARW